MSLESQIQTLTDAINNLAFIMQQQAVTVKATPSVITPREPEPTPISIVETIIKPTASVQMPALPTFMAAPFKAPVKAPFSDAAGLKNYVMTSFHTLGPVKGLDIQNVMVKLGHTNINDLLPCDYDALFAGVEALK